VRIKLDENLGRGGATEFMPAAEPTKFELVIDFKTAKQIGLAIPQSDLCRADKVIK